MKNKLSFCAEAHSLRSLRMTQNLLIESAEEEVQDTSCPGIWGCPPAVKIPQDWGIRGLIETISAVSKY
jgi:hypothetical protein